MNYKWIECNLCDSVNQILTYDKYEQLNMEYQNNLQIERNMMKQLMHEIGTSNEENKKIIQKYEKYIIEMEEKSKIDMILKLLLLNYFDEVALKYYLVDLEYISTKKFVQLIKKKYPNSNIQNIDFSNYTKNLGIKLAYALKLNEIINKTNIPIIVIDKYITIIQSKLSNFELHKINKYEQIQESIEKLKKAGIKLDNEKEINEICFVLQR
jgi:hypothetical protein